jgi:hypothetical protein
MAKNAPGKKAPSASNSKTAASGKNAAAPKKSAGGKLETTAKVVGRTLGRAAKGFDGVKAAVKRVASKKPVQKKAKKDPAAAVQLAKKRELWKSQAAEANSVELAKRGALVDERARVRANVGMSWSNRKPR